VPNQKSKWSFPYEEDCHNLSFWLSGGYAAETIPIVPVGAAFKLSKKVGGGKVLSSVEAVAAKKAGKVPGGILQAATTKLPFGIWHGLKDWQETEFNPKELDRLGRAGANAGLRTRKFPTFDIDIHDSRDVAIADQVEQALGENLFVRYRSNSPGRAVVFKLADGVEPLRKRVVRFKTPSGVESKIELLGDGQQLVVDGTHPSKVPIWWRPERPQTASLPTLNSESATALLKKIREVLEAAGCTIEKASDKKPDDANPSAPKRPFDPWRTSLALKTVSADDYDTWLKVGMACHRSNPDPAGEAFSTWETWSESSSKFQNGTCAEKWTSFKPIESRGLTAATIFKLAFDAGWKPPSPQEVLNSILTRLEKMTDEEADESWQDLITANDLDDIFAEGVREYIAKRFGLIGETPAPDVTSSDEDLDVLTPNNNNAPKMSASWEDLGIPTRTQKSDKGVTTEVVYGTQAMALTLEKHPQWTNRIYLNTFNERMEMDGEPIEESMFPPIAEELRSYLAWASEPSYDLLWKAIIRVAKLQARNPIANWLDSLKWDGRTRINDWLVRAGCEDESITRKIGRKWLIALVARAIEAGCKMDTVLILKGGQGIKKSMLLERIAGPGLYTESKVTLGDKDGTMVMHGHWVVELAELSSFKRSEQADVKQFISTKEDTFRPPYGRTTVTKPRHFVIVGSTNDDEFLTDATGARRYWPIKVTDRLDPALITEERDQLFAEAAVAFKAGEPWWFEKDPEDLVQAQGSHYVHDAIEDNIDEWLDQHIGEEFTLGTLMRGASIDTMKKDLQMRTAAILRRKKYERISRWLPEAGSRWMWHDPLFYESKKPASVVEMPKNPSSKAGEKKS
jgi:hypothetical protein